MLIWNYISFVVSQNIFQKSDKAAFAGSSGVVNYHGFGMNIIGL